MNNKMYTTGKIAEMVDVAPRTVSKWIDSGQLRGFKIPGSNDRRVHKSDFTIFCMKHGIKVDSSYVVIGDKTMFQALSETHSTHFAENHYDIMQFIQHGVSHAIYNELSTKRETYDFTQALKKANIKSVVIINDCSDGSEKIGRHTYYCDACIKTSDVHNISAIMHEMTSKELSKKSGKKSKLTATG